MTWWTAGAIVGGSVVGGLFGSKSASKAANAEKQASAAAIGEQRRQYDTTRADFAPYRKTGYAALDRLNALTLGGPNGPNYSSFYKDPGYNFARTEGIRGIDQTYAGRAGGNALRALGRFTTGLAGEQYGNYWNRVKSLADLGEGATGTVANAGAHSADSISSSLTAMGDANASAALGEGNALTGGINTALNNYLLYRGGYFGKPASTPRNVDMVVSGSDLPSW